MNQEDEIFLHALDLPLAERAAYLDRACAGQPALRTRVEHLLAADAAANPSFLNAPVVPRPAAPVSAEEQTGGVIDRYTLIRKIGEGGCGSVYLAEQTEPVRRQVALKIIKLGMDTASVIARFEAERQALALMDHPDIARVFDAGATASGRPFFVMEFVDGVPITTYCDRHNLSVPARLELFIRTCGAIQHAHQKGIIHRDVKPSNILVSVRDGEAHPKIIDFGIAKATEARLSDATLVTQIGQFMGTPAYMSPEQAQISQGDVDTRTDVYSLGVLLYELLAGKPPFEPATLLQSGLDAMWKQIREVDPPRPSTRLQTLTRDELTTTAAHRVAEPPKLIHRIAGDLDWIVMRALEKDRARRYDSAAGLARDVRRHLANEPVEARPASTRYRVAKLVRRNRLAVTAAAAVLLALLAGTAISTWQALRANRAERLAREEAAAANAVAEFLVDDLLRQADVFFQARSDGATDPDLTVRDALTRAAAKIDERFADQPLVEARLRVAIGESLAQLNQRDEAQRQFDRALELRRAHLGPAHDDTRLAAFHLAANYNQRGDHETGNAKLRALVAEFEALPSLTPEQTLAYNDARSELALGLEAGGQYEEAHRIEKEIAEHNQRVLGPDDPRTLAALKNLASSTQELGRLAEAETILRGAYERVRELHGPEHAETILFANNLAAVLGAQIKYQEAIALLEQTLEISRRVLGPDWFVVLTQQVNLAAYYGDVGRVADSIALNEKTLESARRVLGPKADLTLATLNNLAIQYNKVGRIDESIAMHEELQQAIADAYGPQHPNTFGSLSNLAYAYMAAGRLTEAEAMFRRSVAGLTDALGDSHPFVLQISRNVAQSLERQQRWADALPIRQSIWEKQSAAQGAASLLAIAAGREYAATLGGAGRFDDAVPVWDAMAAALAAQLPTDDPRIIDQQARHATALLAAKHFAAAEPLLRQVLAVRVTTAPDEWTTFNTQAGLGAALLGLDRADEAEPLLRAGCEGLLACYERAPETPALRLRLDEALGRLLELYERGGQSDEAARWNRIRADLPPL